MALGRGMNAVRLIQFRMAPNPFKQERNERHPAFFRERGINRREVPRMFEAQIRRDPHAGEYDRHTGDALADAFDELLQIRMGDFGVDAAQAIVGAEFDDKEIGLLPKNPVQPPKTAGGGIAADPCIHDVPRQAGGIDLFLHEGRVSFVWIQSIACCEAIAQKNHDLRFVSDGANWQKEENKEHGDQPLKQPTVRRRVRRCASGEDDSFTCHFVSLAGPTMSVQSILKVQRLSQTYVTASGPLTVLHDVSFTLEAGDTCAIVGPSGSGKTTLLGLCAGLDQPGSGQVTLAGRELGNLSEDERALVRNECVGFVFQNFQLIPTLTALENVLVPLELRGNGVNEREAVDLLTRVGLADRLDHYPAQLSGGEQQRVALARAFINRPRILFCDEPTGNLDGDTAHAMVELIFGLNRARGTTLVLVTHDLELARRTQRIIRLRSGAVLSDELT